jgi:ATP-dependent DNA helicase RecG
MTLEELKQLIQQGEGYNLEFKQSIPSKASDLAKELCAFANANGGTILVGVDDKGSLVGINISNSIRSEVQQVIGLLDPRLDVHVSEFHLNNKTILCLECNDCPQKPYVVSGTMYVRNGPNSEKITSRERMQKLFQQSDSVSFDSMNCPEFKYPEHFDSAAFKEFLQKANITDTIGEKKVLDNLRLTAASDKLTYAAVLMFAKDVQHFANYATIRCVLFKGTDKRYILDNKEMEGNIVHQFEEALKYIISKLNLGFDIEGQPDGRRKGVLEIPITVFREALINALCHRSYYEKGGSTMVEIYDDRVEISNPGGLISVISEEEFGHKSFSRNPLLFGLMQRINLVEKVGSGITRMQDAMKEAKLPDPVFTMGGFFTVLFYRPVDFKNWIASVKDKLSEKQYYILQRLNSFPDSTIKTMAEALNTTTRTIERNITVLKKLGLLERIGSDKVGHYQINKVSL